MLLGDKEASTYLLFLTTFEVTYLALPQNTVRLLKSSHEAQPKYHRKVSSCWNDKHLHIKKKKKKQTQTCLPPLSQLNPMPSFCLSWACRRMVNPYSSHRRYFAFSGCRGALNPQAEKAADSPPPGGGGGGGREGQGRRCTHCETRLCFGKGCHSRYPHRPPHPGETAATAATPSPPPLTFSCARVSFFWTLLAIFPAVTPLLPSSAILRPLFNGQLRTTGRQEKKKKGGGLGGGG